MLSTARNDFESDGWKLTPVCNFKLLVDFDCGDKDLNDFFQNDCEVQKIELLNQTYSLIEATEGDSFPVALISLCNDSIQKRKIEFPAQQDWKGTPKDYPSYPAVKIARLGVQKQFQCNNIGSHLLNMIKKMFVTNNRTGCRFVTVDAYNNEQALNFYRKNEFQYFSDKDERKQNRAMYFDLKRLVLPDYECCHTESV